MSSFPFSRLPLLAISEVIKSLDITEIFLFSLASKKSQNHVMLSIPKDSFWTDFAIKAEGLLFELRPKGFFKQEQQILPNALYSVQDESSLMRVCSDNRYVLCDLRSFDAISKVEGSTRKLFYRLLKTFKNTEIYLEFKTGAREEFAIELIKLAWENGFQLDHINFRSKNASSESIQELLNGCHEHHTSLHIETKFPEGFKYLPPPGGYKFEYLKVDSLWGSAHWLNLDDFLQCRKVVLEVGPPLLTVKYLNGLLKKIVNLECSIERFTFGLWPTCFNNFPAIVEGLSGNEIMTVREGQWWDGLQFERKDGLKLLVYLSRGYLALREDVP